MHMPASCALYVPKTQGSLLYGTPATIVRTSLGRAVLTAYRVAHHRRRGGGYRQRRHRREPPAPRRCAALLPVLALVLPWVKPLVLALLP